MNVTGEFIAPLVIILIGTIIQRLVLNAPADAVAAVDG
jgi:hypothetical protein